MIFRNILEKICRCVARFPLIWLLLTIIPTIPAYYQIKNLGLNTDIVRLLPDSSRAAKWTRELEGIVGDGGFFTILLKGEDRKQLVAAVEATSERLKSLTDIGSVSHTYPSEFIHKYRYLLISTPYLEKIFEHVVSLKAKHSPFTDDLLSEENAESRSSHRREMEEMQRLFDHYANLTYYHESEDGKIMGIFIRPRPGLTKISQLYKLLGEIEKISEETAEKYSVWTGVGGSQIDNLKNYEVIVRDLKFSGKITVAAILIILIFSFRSVKILPVILYPLATGLLWAFALVPSVLGDLNIITSFLLVVLFGLGVDFAIHLVKRFQKELSTNGPAEALVETYRSTGKAVIVSGLTTGLALLVLVFSDFRGFSEFGLIGGGTLLILLIAMIFVMPPVIILSERLGLIDSVPETRYRNGGIRSRVFIAVTLILPLCLVAAVMNFRFDFDFNTVQPKFEGNAQFNEYNKAVYRTNYMSPGAIFLAPDLKTLDDLLAVIEQQMQLPDTTFLKTRSIRTFVANKEQEELRYFLVEDIKDMLNGSWVDKIEDPDTIRWIKDFTEWQIPPRGPVLSELPETLKTSMVAGDDQQYYVAGLYPNGRRGNGTLAMAFAKEMYGMDISQEIKGPVGEMPVFAEILWTVTNEGPWVVIASFLCVFVIIYLGSRSLLSTTWITLPLLTGLLLTMGIMAVLDLKLNFFNVVVFPALIGMGVDDGVHFYRRWKELGEDTGHCYNELYNPLTVCTLTSMMGYSGMAFASHPGLHSIGILACLGLGSVWFTSLFFYPGFLEWLRRKRPSYS